MSFDLRKIYEWIVSWFKSKPVKTNDDIDFTSVLETEPRFDYRYSYNEYY